MAVHPGFRENSFDCLLQSLMQRKRKLASSALWPMGDTGEDVAELQKMLGSDVLQTGGDPLRTTLEALSLRDGIPNPIIDPDGSVQFT